MARKAEASLEEIFTYNYKEIYTENSLTFLLINQLARKAVT